MKLRTEITLYTASQKQAYELFFQPKQEINSPEDALATFFDFAHFIRNQVEVLAPKEEAYFALGKLQEETDLKMKQLVAEINKAFQLDLKGPFEGCDNLHGNLWKGKDLLDRTEEDAMVQLCFEADAMDLPSHVHHYSDRVVFLRSGKGQFHPNFDSYDEFEKSHVQRIPVEAGNLVVFPRDFVHTFSTQDSEMEMFAYHYPYIPFESEKQFTITEKAWRARESVFA